MLKKLMTLLGYITLGGCIYHAGKEGWFDKKKDDDFVKDKNERLI